MHKSVLLGVAALVLSLGILWLLFIGGPGPPPPSSSGKAGSTPALLPGEQIWRNGSLSYVFGTNDSIEYGNPNVQTIPSVQTNLKQGGLTLMRTWVYQDYSDATILQRLATIRNSGMQCMMMLGTPSNASWMEHVVSLLGPACNIYEVGNEPDDASNKTSIAVMVSQWNAAVPRLRALNRHAVFGGPAVMYPTSSDGSQGAYSSDLAYFLGQTAISGVRADFISYHDYPCYNFTSQAACITHTSEAFAQDQSTVLGWEQQYYGRTIPTGISEYNFDPGSGTLYAWGGDGAFMYQWTVAALNAFVANHFAFALEFTTLNWGGYGNLDMFSDSSPYQPKPQFLAIASVVKREGGPSQLVTPSPSAPLR